MSSKELKKSRILLAGHCGSDCHALETMLQRVGACDVESVESAKDLRRKIESGQFDLILLNRIFDATAESALALLEEFPCELRARCMLVSNFPDAHAAAAKLGAHSGFGKRQLREPQTVELMAKFLGQ